MFKIRKQNIKLFIFLFEVKRNNDLRAGVL
jgi:hypothetical protein